MIELYTIWGFSGRNTTLWYKLDRSLSFYIKHTILAIIFEQVLWPLNEEQASAQCLAHRKNWAGICWFDYVQEGNSCTRHSKMSGCLFHLWLSPSETQGMVTKVTALVTVEREKDCITSCNYRPHLSGFLSMPALPSSQPVISPNTSSMNSCLIPATQCLNISTCPAATQWVTLQWKALKKDLREGG